ncbi:DedA family protein [Clostridium sp. Sa3CUN1]|uniref:DedA family protein n=1 Tax=Clostridium gallinarum TaxID=2762246 RepID=A0ABR8PZJ6_9CLOT|nr:DedA family protein [Clostridium gallinarum]MBD7913581.1 DedA family protein [Clostridium gallinarum]
MNNIQIVVDYLARYGLIFVFIIIFLEYLNCPGLGAAIIMPAIGISSAKAGINFFMALLISIIAGALASYVLYGISYWFGERILTKIYNKFPSTRKSIDKVCFYIENYGDKGVLIIRLLPAVRTLIPFVAGMFKMNIIKFSIYSTLGIAIWNAVFIYAGYAFGYLFI